MDKTAKTISNPKLPLKHLLSVGALGVAIKKKWLGFSMFFSIIMLVVLGQSITFSTVDYVKDELKRVYDSGTQMTIIESDSYFLYPYYATIQRSQIGMFSEKQLQIIEQHFQSEPLKEAGLGGPNIYSDIFGVNINEAFWADTVNPYIRAALSYFSGVFEINSLHGETDANLKPDARLLASTKCELPSEYDQIAITDMKADMFLRFGYRDEDKYISEINTIDELIGKSIMGLTICGIYSTETARPDYTKYQDPQERFENSLDIELFYGGFQILNSAFVCSGFGEYHLQSPMSNLQPPSPYRTLVKLSNNFSYDLKLFKKLTYDERTEFGHKYFSAKITSQYSVFTGDALTYTQGNTITALLIVGFPLLLVAYFVSRKFFIENYRYRKKEFYILRTLGASRTDIIQVFLLNVLLIGVLTIIIPLAIIPIICTLLNNYFFVGFFIFGFPQILLLFLICFGVLFLSSIPSFKRLLRDNQKH